MEQVKQSYRHLAKVWHPDRFSGDHDLQLRAEEKLKGINRAYREILAAHSAGSYAVPERKPDRQADSSSRSDNSTPKQTHVHPSNPTHRRAFRLQKAERFALLIVALVMCAAGFAAYFYSRNDSGNGEPIAIRPQLLRQVLSIEEVIASYREFIRQYPGHELSLAEFSRMLDEIDETKDYSAGFFYRYVLPEQTAFTLGSQRDEVIRAQGTPDQVTEYSSLGIRVWRYGSSSVELKHEVVHGWDDPGGVLKIAMRSSHPMTENFFTEGSHKDEVLHVQGTPSSLKIYPTLGRESWGYAGATVSIDSKSGRVIGWENANGVLKVKMVPRK